MSETPRLSVASKKAPLDPLKQQQQQDALNHKRFCDAQRRYIKCTRGKCPVEVSERTKRMRQLLGKRRAKKDFVSAQTQDTKLARLFIEKGRKKRIEILEANVAELNLKLRVAGGRLHTNAIEENYRKIERHLAMQTEMQEAIKKARLENAHIKSQLERLDRKNRELDLQTKSEVQFEEHLKKATRQLEIYEKRVQLARQKECTMTAENGKLRELLKDMLISRAEFNKIWSGSVRKLKNRKKFLLDMILRSSQAFSQSDEYLDRHKQLLARRRQGRESAIGEMLKMKQQIDANDIMNAFLGGKGKIRRLQPLDSRECNRREKVRMEYNNRLDLYRQIIDEVRRLTGVSANEPIQTCVDRLTEWKEQSFGIITYITRLTADIDAFCRDVDAYGRQINNEQAKITDSKNFLETRIEEMKKEFAQVLEEESKTKREIERLEDIINAQCKALHDMMIESKCDMSSLENKMTDYSAINVDNYRKFIGMFELHLNRLIAFVYCAERDDMGINVLEEDEKLTLKSLKRDIGDEEVKVEDVINTQICPECAAIEDLNQDDDKLVKMLEGEELFEAVNQMAQMPELPKRMHNLSACNLPHSGAVASRRYAE